MDLSTDGLVVSLVIGTVGMGIFAYGKRQQRFPHLIGGAALMICPYFVSGALHMVALGGAIVAAIFMAASAGY